jgi:dTDP-4-dehydrorhamnose 3,5-epimerase
MAPKLTIEETGFKGLLITTRRMARDHRGSFSRLFCQTELEPHAKSGIKQINHSITYTRGTVRGLHYQLPPFAETKIITCIRGKVFDVAVDLRAKSATYLKHFCIELNEESPLGVIIPPGFAHGFQAITDFSEIIYFCTQFYSPTHENSLNPLDPKLNIKWPMAVANLSEKDRNAAFLDDTFHGIVDHDETDP